MYYSFLKDNPKKTEEKVLWRTENTLLRRYDNEEEKFG
jgi:hypothetical protein